MPFSSFLVIFLFPSQLFADVRFEVESLEPTNVFNIDEDLPNKGNF